MLASLHSLLVTARHQLPDPVAFGNAVTERLLRLNHAAKGGLPLQHLADVVSVVLVWEAGWNARAGVSDLPPPAANWPPTLPPAPPYCQVEALAQLRCIDGLSAAPVVNLAASRARAMEEGGIYEAPALVQLARVMNCVAVIAGAHLCREGGPARCGVLSRRCRTHLQASDCRPSVRPPARPPPPNAATTPVQGSTLLAASAIWHLLVVRAEALAQSAAGDSQLAAPTAACLSKMWFASKLLLAVSKATTNGFQLPDRLG